MPASFYGPHSQRIATTFRDGLALSQNNDQLIAVGLSLGSVATSFLSLNSSITSGCAGMTSPCACVAKLFANTASPIAEATVKFFGE